jgi:hypothetical protein
LAVSEFVIVIPIDGFDPVDRRSIDQDTDTDKDTDEWDGCLPVSVFVIVIPIDGLDPVDRPSTRIPIPIRIPMSGMDACRYRS